MAVLFTSGDFSTAISQVLVEIVDAEGKSLWSMRPPLSQSGREAFDIPGVARRPAAGPIPAARDGDRIRANQPRARLLDPLTGDAGDLCDPS